MRKIEGLSRPEIAARLGVAEATVSQYLAQGMTRLLIFFITIRAILGTNREQ